MIPKTNTRITRVVLIALLLTIFGTFSYVLVTHDFEFNKSEKQELFIIGLDQYPNGSWYFQYSVNGKVEHCNFDNSTIMQQYIDWLDEIFDVKENFNLLMRRHFDGY
jgi:hypothetical protein